MLCSSHIYKLTGTLHVLALIISFVGMLMQIDAVNSGNPYSLWLPLSLALMLLLRIPNQVCVALQHSHGWYSVVGTCLAIFGYVYLTIITKKKGEQQ